MAVAVVDTIANGTSSTTLVNTFSGPVGNHITGNALLVFVKWEGTSSDLTVTDTQGNTYTNLSYKANSNGDLHSQWAYVLNMDGNAANTITASWGTTGAKVIQIIAIQVSGLGTSGVNDGDVTMEGVASPIDISSLTTTGSDEIVAAASADYGAGVVSAQQIDSVSATMAAAAVDNTRAWYRVLTGVLTNAHATATTSQPFGPTTYNGHLVAFKPGAASPPPNVDNTVTNLELADTQVMDGAF